MFGINIRRFTHIFVSHNLSCKVSHIPLQHLIISKIFTIFTTFLQVSESPFKNKDLGI